MMDSFFEYSKNKNKSYNVDKVLKEYRELIKDYEDNGYTFHISDKVEDIIRKGGI